jgi:Recombination endonuclease VII
MAWSPEKRREYAREWARRRRADPKYREKLKTDRQKFLKEHPSYHAEWQRQRRQDPGYRAKNADNQRRWRQNNPEKAREAARRYRETHLEERREYARRWRETRGWTRKLRERYGITPEQYAELLAAQGGGCAICGMKPGARRLSVDHDHSCCPGDISCGWCVRGLLCHAHNVGLAHFADNEELLMAAARYVTSPPGTALWGVR